MKSVWRLNSPLIFTTMKSPFWPLNPLTPGKPPRPCKQVRQSINQLRNRSLKVLALCFISLLCGDSPADPALLFLQINHSLLWALEPLGLLETLETPCHLVGRGHQSVQPWGRKHSHQSYLKNTGKFKQWCQTHHWASFLSVWPDDTRKVVQLHSMNKVQILKHQIR